MKLGPQEQNPNYSGLQAIQANLVQTSLFLKIRPIFSTTFSFKKKMPDYIKFWTVGAHMHYEPNEAQALPSRQGH